MAAPRALAASFSVTRLAASSPSIIRPAVCRFATPTYQTVRCKGTKTPKKKAATAFTQYDLSGTEHFALVDAMRYIRAFEVGREPSSSKYEVAVRLRTIKNSPSVRSRIRLPHTVKTDIRIWVVAPPDSKAGQEARAAGAALIGEDEIFEQVKAGVFNFNMVICHADSLQKLTKAGMPRILGPRGMMPTAKTGTVVDNIASSVGNIVGGSEFRERMGVIRMAVGQLGFTPAELQDNIKKFMDALKHEMSLLQGRVNKEIHEVVLSSTNSPGFTLSGEFKGANSISPALLNGPL
ncbi:ribosomal protein L1-like protein [Boeremia exigua]|uniref:ribosomal protein L1-like protein n=1 Tax=Boeremia exigua TaxID=749465 RepID=UPI001E8EA23A|nr:ribosomal protein L1-like protein [Boeremia exigua]KAH6638913.1 ribosomal protein L1-like protein [Boeremia exigua]